MNKFYVAFLAILVMVNIAHAQDCYLTTGDNFSAAEVFTDYDMLLNFDICDGLLYAHTGDTIIVINMSDNSELAKYGKPSGYNALPSFVYANPSQNEIWAGFTVTGNIDDRIYRIDTETGQWEFIASLTGNFDMEIIDGHLLVNGIIYGVGDCIYLLDTSGENNHRVIIEIFGNSAGITSDTQGNLYYGTSVMANNKLLKWSGADILSVVSNPEAAPLQIVDAEKLTDSPASIYDCDMDDAGNLVFTLNDYYADKVLAMWNGTAGDGENFDTLAYTTDAMDWLTVVKTTGNLLDQGDENGAFVLSYAHPIAKINGTIPAPQQIQPFGVIQQPQGSENLTFNLSEYFTNPNSEEELLYSVISNSFTNVATADINENDLVIGFNETGQTVVNIQVSNTERTIVTQLIIGVYDEILGDYIVADFEDLELTENSYWNGANGEGFFQTANAIFSNRYNTEHGTWEQWAYSSITDNTTPGHGNQYGAITGGGFEANTTNSGTYGVSHVSSYNLPTVKFANDQAHIVKGFYVTNSTYAALSMRDGDGNSKKFGGILGSDPDWFKLSVFGFYNYTPTDTVHFYLADFRFDEPEKDHIIQTWQWVELGQLGYVDSLQMVLSSSDIGESGMNTPAYFCADNLYTERTENSIETLANESNFNMYPNPANSQIIIQLHGNANGNLRIINTTGAIVKQEKQVVNNQQIDISNLAPGLYFVQIQTLNSITTKRLVKQ